MYGLVDDERTRVEEQNRFVLAYFFLSPFFFFVYERTDVVDTIIILNNLPFFFALRYKQIQARREKKSLVMFGTRCC